MAYENHDTPTNAPKVSKGEFVGIGTYVPLKDQAFSPNQKTGEPKPQK
jgi:hypothetical protein